MRGGAEALHPPQTVGIAGRPFSVNEGVNVDKKRAIARAAVALCEDGESIIINGGTTTFQMVHDLSRRRMQILTNSFPIAETPAAQFEEHDHGWPARRDLSRAEHRAVAVRERRDAEFLRGAACSWGAQGLSRIGVMESDPLLIQAEQKLINQAEELVLLVDSSKFAARSSLILCPLERVNIVITDDGVSTAGRQARRTIRNSSRRRRPRGRRRGGVVGSLRRRHFFVQVTNGRNDKNEVSEDTRDRQRHGAGARRQSGLGRQPQDRAAVKNLGNSFFDAANKGALEAAKELGNVDIIYTGPTQATPEGQIDIINQLVSQKVNAIAVSANDADALVPALKAAMAAGVTVISFDSGVSKDGRQMNLLASETQLIGDQNLKMASDLLGGGEGRRRRSLGDFDGDQPERLDRRDEGRRRQVSERQPDDRRLWR